MTRRILVMCILIVASSMLSSCERRSTRRVGEHHVEIIETGGVSKRSSTFHKTGDGRVTYTYESAKLTVKLEDEILTVNGRKYLASMGNARPKRNVVTSYGKGAIDCCVCVDRA